MADEGNFVSDPDFDNEKLTEDSSSAIKGSSKSVKQSTATV